MRWLQPTNYLNNTRTWLNEIVSLNSSLTVHKDTSATTLNPECYDICTCTLCVTDKRCTKTKVAPFFKSIPFFPEKSIRMYHLSGIHSFGLTFMSGKKWVFGKKKHWLNTHDMSPTENKFSIPIWTKKNVRIKFVFWPKNNFTANFIDRYRLETLKCRSCLHTTESRGFESPAQSATAVYGARGMSLHSWNWLQLHNISKQNNKTWLSLWYCKVVGLYSEEMGGKKEKEAQRTKGNTKVHERKIFKILWKLKAQFYLFKLESTKRLNSNSLSLAFQQCQECQTLGYFRRNNWIHRL